LASLNVCIQAMNTQGPAWDLPSVNGSWNVITAVFGSSPGPGKDPFSSSRSPADPLILIVEDNPLDVFLIRDALKTAGVRGAIHVVDDGPAATAFFDQANADENAPCPSLILLDMNLPKKSGAEVLQHLRASGRCSRALVLIVSSSDAPRERTAVDGFQVAGYFKKPSEYASFMKLGPLVRDLLQEPGPNQAPS
jgi:chemotaxis family two-component system response regulator Rcp1